MPKEIKALFEGVDGLSDSFIAEAEAAVQHKVDEALTEAALEHTQEISTINEAHEAELLEKDALIESAGEEAVETLIENVDEFLDQKLNEWAVNNAEAIDGKIKVGLAESFLTGVAGLMAEHNVVVPKGKENLVESLEKENIELETRANELMAENVQLKTEKTNELKEGVINTVCEGLADTQVDTIRSLVEGVEFKNENAFQMRVEAAKTVVEGKGKDKDDDDEDDGDKKPVKEGKKVCEGATVVDEAGQPLNENVDTTHADVLAFING